jgi:hypothetical protein
MPLTGGQSQQFEKALASAFFNRNQLEMMLFHQLTKNLLDYAAEGIPHPQMVRQLVAAAESEGWTDDLVAGALKANPGNPKLRAFYEQVWLALGVPGGSRSALQTLIRPGEEFQDVDGWLSALVAIGPKVCCIEVNADKGTNRGVLTGTGFLLSKDLVITNFHVMEPVIAGEQGRQTDATSGVGSGYAARTGDVRVRFDYKLLPDGTPLASGSVHQLKGPKMENWLVDQSPFSKVDFQQDPGEATPTVDELDYALFRLATPAGDDALPNQPAVQRGWITLPETPVAVTNDAPLLILQHPEGKPLKLAFHAVAGQNGNGTRVTYRVATEHGSSGAPCFNYKWDLVALHHSGDPGYKPVRNQGVPFTAIRARMARQGITV